VQRSLLSITLVLFGALSAAALWQHGYLGIFALHFQTFGGAQVLADLAIALVLVMTWMWHDARATGRNVWPWIVATLALGSFGPLLYLLTRKSAATPPTDHARSHSTGR
jgi:hypothetical protein